MRYFLVTILLVGLAAADWACIGPYGGPMISAAVSPSNPQIVYASPQGYPTPMLKSIDGGENWTPTGSMGYYAWGIAIHQTNPDDVVAAIGSTVRTTNGGAQWNYATVPGGTYARGIARCPADPQRIYTTGYCYITDTVRLGVNVSTDGGATWDSVCVEMAPNSNGYAVAVDPADPDVVYAGGYPGSGSGAETWVYKSTDGGGTWARLNTGINGYYVYALHVSAADPSIVVCGTSSAGILRSTDAGATWTQAVNLYNIQTIAAAPGNQATIYACNDTGLLRSVDTGRTWTAAGRVPGTAVRALATTAASSSTVFCGSKAGLYRSLTSGGNWEPLIDDVAIAKVSAIGLSPAEPGTIYAEYKDNAVYKSTDNGASWARMPEFLSCGSLCGFVIDRTNPAIVWALEGSG